MKAIFLLSLLAITLNQVDGLLECTGATASCVISHNIVGKTTCGEKFPFFKCLREKECDRDDTVYKSQVKLYSYEKCDTKDSLNQVDGIFECTRATASCLISDNIVGKTTCNDKLPFFKCLRDKGCDRDDTVYKSQVKLYSYEKCDDSLKKGSPDNAEGSGACAIIMEWTLTILMFTVSKYFSK